LVVCSPDVIIFSVKQIALTETGEVAVDVSRWRRRAIDASLRQIYGAERRIGRSSSVITHKGEVGLELPAEGERRIHRVAVAFGADRRLPIPSGDFGRGFVHVFDEVSLDVVMGELDTISDFVTYLGQKESLLRADASVVVNGGEEDLVAMYLRNSRTFPDGFGLIIVDGGLWDRHSSSQEYLRKKGADQISYVWDRLIEIVCSDFERGQLDIGDSLSEVERATRFMAREDRFCRRLLGGAFWEFYQLAAERKVRSRMVPSPSGVLYVFLATGHDEDRESRVGELGLRSFVARGLHPEHITVVGIATERHEAHKGFSLDLMCLTKSDWTAEDQTEVDRIQERFGYFACPVESRTQEDEYPAGRVT
jgi:hypothetical protein